MSLFISWILLVLGAYFTGSFPTGYLVGRCCGIDIRQHGSGNIGATNVLRILGKKWGGTVFAVDFCKGWLPVILAIRWGELMHIDPHSAPGATAGLIALLGHSFPCWLGFRGGKGIATSAGIIIGLFPEALPFCVASWLAVFFTTGYVSLASLVAAAMLPLTVLGFYVWSLYYDLPSWVSPDWLSLLVALLMGSIVIWRHRGNLQRLCKGTEHNFKKSL